MLQNVNYFVKNELYYWLMKPFKKYYIIRRQEGGAGFFSNYFWVMGHIVFAHKLGYIPVVDMKYYKTLYNENCPVNGEWNAWNYYFEDVENVNIDDVIHSKRSVYGQKKYLTKYSEKYSSSIYRYPTEQMIDYYYPIIEKNIRIKADILNSFNREWMEVNANNNGELLGIHVRGTDMRNDLGHPVPASVEVYLKETEKILNANHQITKVFLATDEIQVVEKFRNFMKDKNCSLVVNEGFRAKESHQKKKTGIHELEVKEKRELHKYRLGLEVLKDAYFLSKCDYLLCGHSNVTNIAIIWNNKKYNQVKCI